ncbi:MAG TPA: hypothetical protein VII35_17240, partial [Steroidobacteraceae bacterium]
MNQNDGSARKAAARGLPVTHAGRLLRAVLILGCTTMALIPVAGASAATAPTAAPTAPSPPPLKIDLNAFDASKKSVALPNGVSLAYVDMGERSAPAV